MDERTRRAGLSGVLLVARFTEEPEQPPARPAVVDGTEIRLTVVGPEPGVLLVRPLPAGTP
ncbi:hypothetical protein ABZW10_13545 [Kitasatospora sp. NPDC004723]|uniref:hypothetical protein n=1 Tax=Kitasatospora sp. NPDC004723 TaxID=3154288 RepID=UPI0033A1067C